MKARALAVVIGVAIIVAVILASKGASMASPASSIRALCGTQIC